MTAEELFEQVIQSPILHKNLNTTYEFLKQEGYNGKSMFPEIEVIKTILRDEKLHRPADITFNDVKKQIL